MTKDVSEFLLVPPSTYAGSMDALKALIDAEMAVRYPRYSFGLATVPDFQMEEDCAVIPLMGYAGDAKSDPDRVYMCNPLPPGLIEDIQKELREILSPAIRRAN